ncbi:MAG: RNA methyltransferase [Clostridia bacterium]|nr:RNA methyltransferase [Clostridia bacterium]
MQITSKSNPKIKKIASLKQKKYREEYGEYLVEGYKMVKEAFETRQDVLIVAGTAEGLMRSSDFVEKTDVEIVEVSESVMEYISDSVTPQGIIAVIKKPKPSYKGDKVSVLLDGISDPGNMGTIIRTSVALGIREIYLINCCDPFSPKVIRSSMSGIFSVDIFEESLKEATEDLKGIPLIVADMDGENIFSFTPPEKYCVVIGNEANGVSEEVRKRADKIISIPMEKGMESLNAGVSFAITAYTLKYLRR